MIGPMMRMPPIPRFLTSFPACLWLIVIAANLQTQHVAQSAEPPNIIFLLADDQCKYSMGCYETPGAKTPNLDTLASQGVAFDRHYDTTAICMASRATIMSGLYEYRTGCNFNTGPMLDSIWQSTYPQRLRQAGYSTAFAGKFGFLVSQDADGKGKLPEQDFDAWGGGPGQTNYETHRNPSMQKYAEQYPHSTLSYAAFAKDVIGQAAHDKKPFCLSISFKAPHQPTTPDPKFDDVYADAVFERPENYGRPQGEHFSLQSRQGRQFERFHSWHYSDDYDRVMATYYQQIYAIDVAVGQIRESLELNGLDQNTVIIYTSDNGFMCGSHGYGSKVLPYEESSCVPLIIYDPRLPAEHAGKRCDALTGNIDLAPTILELAGETIPDEVDGKSLVHLLRDPAGLHHQQLSLMNIWGPEQVHSFAVVTPNLKLIYWPFASDQMQPGFEMYDMQTDRLELVELARQPEHATQTQAMKQRFQTAVNHWQQHGVPFHGYPNLAKQFVIPTE